MWAASDPSTGEVILSVSVGELEGLVLLLRDHKPVCIGLQSSAARASLRSLSAIRIESGDDGGARLALDADDALLTGGRTALLALAEEIATFAECNDLTEPGMHCHFEPYDAMTKRGVLAHGSAPLIIAGPTSDDEGL